MLTLIVNGFLWCPEGDLNSHNRFRSADFKSPSSPTISHNLSAFQAIGNFACLVCEV